MNTISAALETLRSTVADAVGPSVLVTRDPAAVGPRVAADGFAVLVAPPISEERSSFKSWLMQVPTHVVYGTPAPRHLDRAYDIADLILSGADIEAAGFTNTPVQLDAAMTLPSVTVIIRTSTEC